MTDELTTRLRRRGLRVTPQRAQVYEAVRRLGHGTPDELAEAVEGVDLATVYRALDVLEDVGLVKHAHFGHGAPSYRPADDDHVHVVCHACGAVVDSAPSLVDELARQLDDDHGFELDRAHFTVFGRCAACRARDVATPGEQTALAQR